MICYSCKRETRRKCDCPESTDGYCEPKVFCWCGASLVRTKSEPNPSGLPPLAAEGKR